VIVCLLRHGDAEDHGGPGGDAARALTAEGRDKLERASRAWCRVLRRVDRILASPLLRAQETAAILRSSLGKPPRIETEPALLPDADPALAIELLRGCVKGSDTVACVGHEPHLGRLLGLLLTGSERLAIPMRKGMLALVEIESHASMVGRLVAVMSQKVASGL
jgi:phosphohistidine phosphatase